MANVLSLEGVATFLALFTLGLLVAFIAYSSTEMFLEAWLPWELPTPCPPAMIWKLSSYILIAALLLIALAALTICP